MNKKILPSLLFSLCLYPAQVFAANSELAPRKGMSPLDRAKIHSVQAQNWSRIGVMKDADVDSSSDTDNGTSSGTTSSNSGVRGVGSKTCNTNIGTTTTKKGVSSGRFGPKNDSDKIIVVKGDVISLCK